MRVKKIIMDSLPLSQNRVDLVDLYTTVSSFCTALNVDVDNKIFLSCVEELKEEQALCVFNKDVVATNFGFKKYNINYFD